MRRKLAVLGVSLALLVPSAYSIVRSLDDLGWLPSPARVAAPAARATARPPGPPVPDNPSERCELRIFPGGRKGELIVGLTKPGKMTEFRPAHFGRFGRLHRELVRQAILVTVRDELNLPVRDESIGDPLPSDKPADVVEVDTLCQRDGNQRPSLLFCREKNGKRVSLFERPVRKTELIAEYRDLLSTVEDLSRTELPKALREAGLKGEAPPKTGDGHLPDGVGEQLGRMSFPQQFGALRRLHAAIRGDGPSPERLGALARAYANLGLLTEFQWDAASKAYQARALLYAQRLLAANHDSPIGYWYRAYASALAGSHWIAIADLQEAHRVAEALPKAKRPVAPDWVDLIDDYVHYAADKLSNYQGPEAELAALLHLLTVEQPPGTDMTVRAARAAIGANPECFRAHDALCEVGGVANMHSATVMAPEILSRVTLRRIAALPEVPEAVRKAVQGEPDEVGLTRALDEAAQSSRDRVEPSWGALARIVRETRFVHTFRRLSFMHEMWSVPTGDYWQQVRPLVAGHRFRPFLEGYVVGPSNHPGLRAFAEDLDTSDIGLNAIPMYRILDYKIGERPDRLGYPIAKLLSDWVVRDLGALLLSDRPAYSPEYTRKLLSVSLYSPYGAGLLVEDAWVEAEEKLDGWKKVIGEHPTFLASLARHSIKTGGFAEAERLLKRYIERSPDLWAYQELANQYAKAGEVDRQKATLDEFLEKTEDHGLDHAKVRVGIAEALMSKGRYEEARPYAEAAAQTWAGWAMQTAQKCAEGLKDWKTAEAWAHALTERYPNTSLYTWLDFCQRTGHGDLAAARDFTLEYLDAMPDQSDASAAMVRACLLMMRGEAAKAIEPLEQLCERSSSDQATHQQALVTATGAAALAGDKTRFDEAARRFIDRYQKSSPRFSAILAELRKALAGASPGTPDLKAIDTELEQTPKEARGNAAFFVANYLEGQKRHRDAEGYWNEAEQNQGTYWLWRLVAASFIRERTAEPKTEAEPKP